MKTISLDIYIRSNFVHSAKILYDRDSRLNIIFDDNIVVSYEKENDTTLFPGDITIDIPHYYYLSSISFDGNYLLPFIIDENNNLFWDVPFDFCRIDDFLYTHQIQNGVIRAKESSPNKFLPDGVKDILQLWEECHATFQLLSVYITVALGLPEVINRIKSLLIKRNISPYPLLDVIFTKEEWNHFLLSELLKIDTEDTKKLLQGLGYQWDNSKKLYIISSVSYELREKLSKYRTV